MSDIAAVVLAAGIGSRFLAADASAGTKLLAELGGKPLVRHVVEAALASCAGPVIVVTGHAKAAVTAALAGLGVEFVDNPQFSDGLASSLRAGIAAVPEGAAGAIVLLGDMPLVTAALIDRLAHAFSAEGAVAAIPVHRGMRGNPVVLSKELFEAVQRLSGDQGARKLLACDARIVEVEVADAAVTSDIDTPEELARLSGRQADGQLAQR